MALFQIRIHKIVFELFFRQSLSADIFLRLIMELVVPAQVADIITGLISRDLKKLLFAFENLCQNHRSALV
jgi:hypothetical protein